jgi:hypothetical protein
MVASPADRWLGRLDEQGNLRAGIQPRVLAIGCQPLLSQRCCLNTKISCVVTIGPFGPSLPTEILQAQNSSRPSLPPSITAQPERSENLGRNGFTPKLRYFPSKNFVDTSRGLLQPPARASTLFPVGCHDNCGPLIVEPGIIRRAGQVPPNGSSENALAFSVLAALGNTHRGTLAPTYLV